MSSSVTTLELNSSQRRLLTAALLPTRNMLKDVENLRARFRKNLFYMSIASEAQAHVVVKFITGEVREDNWEIQELKQFVEECHGDFPDLVTAMIHIIREELEVK